MRLHYLPDFVEYCVLNPAYRVVVLVVDVPFLAIYLMESPQVRRHIIQGVHLDVATKRQRPDFLYG